MIDFQKNIKILGERVTSLKDDILTEESTKNAFIMPLIQLLGYDIFNPKEVIPEFTADIGIKKGEKVDYAIIKDNKPILIIECKQCKTKLDVYKTQLHRYFHVTKSRFSLLTDGINYQLFTDLVEPNIMDDEPFLEFNIENISDNDITELYKFHKSIFEIDLIFNNANNLKYSNDIKNLLKNELTNPSEEFIKYITKRVYTGKIINKKVIEQFTNIITPSINQVFNDIINKKLQTALNIVKNDDEDITTDENKIITTDEEIESFFIIKSMIRTNMDINLDRIVARDKQTYFGILLDNNNRKPICRIHLNGNKKYISIFDHNREEIKTEIESLDDIYLYTEQILNTILMYDNQ
jgi:predicted type IV restriction endonuclease